MSFNPKAYARRLRRFLSQSNTLTGKEAWKIQSLLKDARNDVVQRIRNVNNTEWDMFFLPTLRAELDKRINDITGKLVIQSEKSTRTFYDFAKDEADDLLLSIDASIPTITLPRELLSASQTLTAELVKTIGDDLKKKLGTRLSLGLFNGKTPFQTAQDLTKAFELTLPEASRIVRTEYMRTVSLAEQKRFQQISEANPDLRKFWIWSGKSRTGHAEAQAKYQAEPILVEKPFLVRAEINPPTPYEKMMFPRDSSMGATAKNIIHCGCLHGLTREPLNL